MSGPDGPPPQRPEGARQGRIQRGLGVPSLFAAAYSAVGFSIYFALGVVADRGLGLTPLIFLAAGLLFGLTTLTYVEGGAMFRERGGSSTFARYAFNELIAFIAGWAILIDYLIVIALAAISVPHYLTPISASFGDPGWEIGIAAAVIAGTCVLNILNISGRGNQRSLAALALADLGLQLAVIVVGAARRPAPGPAHRRARPLHRPQLHRHRLRRGGGDARLRGDRGRLRPRPGHRRRPSRPEADRHARRRRRAAGLRRHGGDRADGGAGRRRAERPRDRARQPVRRGPGARGRLRLPSRLGRRLDALDGRPDRRPGPVLGGQHLDARRLPPHLHAGDQPPDPELAGQARQARRDPLRGDRRSAA